MRLTNHQLTASLAWLSALAATAFSSTALAQSGCTDGACPDGYECQTSIAGCVIPACEILADGGVNCPQSECEPEEYTYCSRASCESDADCGDEMVCHTFEQTICSDVGVATPCAPGAECDDVVYDDAYVSECTQTTNSQCAYPHELPCETDTQCGEGYECVATQSCWCTGSGPAPSTDPALPGSVDEGHEEPECGCEPSGVNHCQRLTIDCDSDADCPTSWSCIDVPGSCWMDSEGNTGCDEGASNCFPMAYPNEPRPGGDDGDPGTTPGSGPSEPTPPPAPTGGSNAPQDNAAGEEGGGHHAGHPGSGHHFGFWAACSINQVGGNSSGAPWALCVLALGAALVRRRQS